jgi:hypothetical protein
MILLFVVWMFIQCQPLHAQKIMVEFGPEYGTYSMSQLHSFQGELQKKTSVQAKNVHAFPAYWGYQGKFYLIAKRFEFGFTAGVNSTGARTSWRDYSGEVRYDQLAKVVHLGVGCQFRLNKEAGRSWETFLSIKTETSSTDYNFNYFLELDGTTISDEKYDFTSKSIVSTPSFIVRKNFFGQIFISGSVGFLLDLGGDLKYNKDKKLYFLNNAGEPLSTNWTGLRLGITAGVKL